MGSNSGRSSPPSPLYAQLEEEVRERIQSGTWPPGTRLPSERVLSERYGLSRDTTRTALQRLERAGVVKRIPRQGTVVLPRRTQLKALSLRSFTDQVLEAGSATTSKLIRFETALPPGFVADQLGVAPGEMVYSIERLRRVDNVAVALHHSYLPMYVAPDLNEAELETESLYTILTRKYGIAIAHAQETLQSTLATNYESALLDVAPGAPMLQLSILLGTRVEEPVEFVRVILRGDRVTLTSQI